MARTSKPSDPTDKEIYEIHRRFIKVMEDRLPAISAETKGRYLQVLKSLTGKLEVSGKPLSEVASEMMAEAAPLLFQTMQSS